jgi:2,4-dienoyl-CoA reductase-like NADH-dependent reductase (Old Yellow Enzyme family)
MGGMRFFEKMFDSAFMGTLEVKNRIVVAPMAARFASEVGEVTRRLIDYYVERSEGGIGTIITEAVCFDTFDGAKPRFLNRGKKRHSVSTLSIPRASDRGVERVDYPLGALSPKNVRTGHHSLIAGHNELVKFVHAYETKTLCLLWHHGRNNRVIDGRQPAAPSAIACKFTRCSTGKES